MIPIADLRSRLEQAFPGDGVQLQSADNRHYQCVVVSTRFEGQSMVERHQMVYAALGNAMEEAVHALALKTYTPAQWEKMGGGA